ncbi:MAG: acyl-CoA dehydrogenase family protein [Bacteroidota bacterium]
MDLTTTPKAQELHSRAKRFIREELLPIEEEILHQGHETRGDWTQWQIDPRIDLLKEKARSQGLWNMFLPGHPEGLSNLDYAPIAEVTGYSILAPELFNCNAPDTGNMEVLWKYGSEEQKEQWLTQLLDGKIRSAFCMTEPAVASSDATNMEATITDKGDHIVLNGRKWWSSGIGHPNCKVLIFMGLSDAEGERHKQHSMALVPLDTPGVKIERMLPVFNAFDAPFGHGEVSFNNVELPKSTIIAGMGRGFEIAQGRLGPGRIHHCMRLIGAAERALELMIKRGSERVAFGSPLLKLGGNVDIIANSRMDLDMTRLLLMKTAWLLDNKGVKAALSEVAQIKVVAPNVACRVIDAAMQMHGGKGLSNDTVLPALYAYARVLRLADGPDEVHRRTVARIELKKYR